MIKEWLFKPLDTIFFRNGLSLDKGEHSWLVSLFPPTPQTMQGIVRYTVITKFCDAPDKFGKVKCVECSTHGKCLITAAIGTPVDGEYGALDLYGPYIVKDGVRYFKSPLDLTSKGMAALKPSDNPVPCDLGNVRLPVKEEQGDFDTPGWISEQALVDYLFHDRMPKAKNDLLDDSDLYCEEPRVGIARKYDSHKVEDGMLYSIVPLRLNGVGIGLKVAGVDGLAIPESFNTKFGGEGKICSVTVNASTGMDTERLKSGDKRVRLVLLQHADFDGEWRPSELKETVDKDSKITYWEGEITGLQGVKLRLVSACVGKPQKVGGWNMAKKEVKAMKGYVPAGSVCFFEVLEGDPSTLKIEGKIGNNTKIGFGHYLLGRW